jgi:mercuric ion binding protein
MKKLLATATIFCLLATTAQAETILASVNGLVCSFCAKGIEKTFNAQSQVEHVTVDLDHKLVTIHTKEKQTLDDKKVTKLITDAGFTVTKIVRK